MKGSKSAGFTYIEMLIALAVVACCFVPMLEMYARSVSEVKHYADIGTAMNLAREGMEKLQNMHISESQLAALGDTWDPPLPEKPIELNHQAWRLKRIVERGTRPLEVHVQVFYELNHEKPMLDITTLFADL